MGSFAKGQLAFLLGALDETEVSSWRSLPVQDGENGEGGRRGGRERGDGDQEQLTPFQGLPPVTTSSKAPPFGYEFGHIY